MGYACPVCGDPQSDSGHLANHLAFTAMLRGGDHKVWLDANVEGWADRDASSLGAAVAELAEETEFPQVFEDTTEGDSNGTHSRGDLPPGSDELADEVMDEQAREAVAEARELTRRRRGEEESEGNEAE